MNTLKRICASNWTITKESLHDAGQQNVKNFMTLNGLNTAKHFKTCYYSGVFHFTSSLNQILINYRGNAFF